jgi:hypothetical protein
MQALLAQRDLHAFPVETGTRPRIEKVEHVPTHLQVAGASVLLASMPQGPLRRAVSTAMAPTAALPFACEAAQALVARAQSLAAQAGPSPLAATAGSVR